MDYAFFHKPLLISSTIVFLLGLFLALQPNFKEFYILEYKEIYVVIFGYLPTWGVFFSLSLKDLVSRNRGLFIVSIITLYCLLHYFTLRLRLMELTLTMTSLGALMTLVIFKLSKKKIVVRFIDYSIVTIIGRLTFLPWGFTNNLLTVTCSVYLWQLTIGHYLNYLITKSKNAI